MKTGALLRLRVLAARANQTVGWAGLTGIALMLAASAWAGVAWREHVLPIPVAELPALSVASGEAQRVPLATTLQLSIRSELPLLITQIQQTVVSNGLGWSAADYKVTAATETAPASLEVRCSLKGTYPKLRAAVAQLLRGVSGLTIRDFAMSRPNSDAPEVDAKLTLVVFLQDDASMGERAALKGGP